MSDLHGDDYATDAMMDRVDATRPYLCPDCDRPRGEDCVCWIYEDVATDEDTLDVFEKIAAARHNAKRANQKQKGEAA